MVCHARFCCCNVLIQVLYLTNNFANLAAMSEHEQYSSSSYNLYTSLCLLVHTSAFGLVYSYCKCKISVFNRDTHIQYLGALREMNGRCMAVCNIFQAI